MFHVTQKENEDEQTEIKLNTVDGWKRRQTRLRSILVDLLLTRAEQYHITIIVFLVVIIYFKNRIHLALIVIFLMVLLKILRFLLQIFHVLLQI